MSNIHYIEIQSGAEIYRIAASIANSPPPGVIKEGMVITSTSGMMGTGERSQDPKPRSYSNGSVFNKNAPLSGIRFSIPITFYGENEQGNSTAYEDVLDFRDFIGLSKGLVLTIYGRGRTRSYNCISQGFVPGDTDKDAIESNLVLEAREAL